MAAAEVSVTFTTYELFKTDYNKHPMYKASDEVAKECAILVRQALLDAKSFKDKGTAEAAEAMTQKEATEGTTTQKEATEATATQKEATEATVVTRTSTGTRCAELCSLEAENDKPWYTKTWDFVTRPKTLWNEARSNKLPNGKPIDDSIETGESLGVFGTIKHILWPSSTGAKVAYAAGAATVATGVVSGLKYTEHRKDQLTSESRKKLVLTAAGLAATGVAAVGVYKACEAYQARQEPDEYLDEAEELQTPEKDHSQAVGRYLRPKSPARQQKPKDPTG